MPLEAGSSNEVVGRNISREVHAGKPQQQAVAIAMQKAGRSKDDAVTPEGKKIVPSRPPRRDEDCPQHGYMDACRRGDSAAMSRHGAAMVRGRIAR